MCRLFIENQNIINYLLDIVQNYCNISLQEVHQIKAAALRVLTYLCASRSAIKQIMDEIITNKCLSSLVLNESEEIILKETVGLLVQLTTPFIDSKDKQIYSDELWNVSSKSLINELISCLTEIIKTTGHDQIFLMACAAIANISFMNTDSLVKFETITHVINAAKRKDEFDRLLLIDQIITLLANASHKHPLDIVSSGGLMYLLNALNIRVDGQGHHYQEDEAEQMAICRIQQKVAVAIARLAAHKSTAKIIFKLNGVHRLVHLCQDARQRNYSDTVLLACIAALKRISQSIGRSPFKELNALDLIDQKLKDSFAQYSHQKESLV